MHTWLARRARMHQDSRLDPRARNESGLTRDSAPQREMLRLTLLASASRQTSICLNIVLPRFYLIAMFYRAR